MTKLRQHVERPDGLIDGQDGEEALLGVIGHGVPRMVCQALAGLADDDPRLAALLEDVAAIVESPDTQYARLEAGLVLLARHVEPAQLPGALGMLIDALLPNELEKRAADGHANRGFGTVLNADGDGWHITDRDLDVECGELLDAVIAAEMAVDPDNPADTAKFEQRREDGWTDTDALPEQGQGGPRSLRQKRHDALKNALRRYLNTGIAGLRDKSAPNLDVIVGADLLDQHPGALPAVSARTGARRPASLVRRWAADSSIARFVLSLGGRVIETSHRQRTLKPHERRAKRIETGGWCQRSGCRSGPGRRMNPHHGEPWRKCGTTRSAAWLTDVLGGARPIGLADAVVVGALRMLTHRKVFADPAPPAAAWAFLDAVRQAPAACPVSPTEATWRRLGTLLETDDGLRGNVVPDAWLAALALSHGAAVATRDRGFARFPGLSLVAPG